jgi:hypothetical protein
MTALICSLVALVCAGIHLRRQGPLLLLAVLVLSAGLSCTPAQRATWKATGISAGICVGEAVLRAALGALADLTTSPPATKAEYAEWGKAKAMVFGVDAVRCAASVLLSRTADHQDGKADTVRPRQASVDLAAWLIDNPAEWQP